MSVGTTSSAGSSEAGDLLPRWLPHKAGKLMLALGKKLQFFLMWATLQSFLTVLTTWQLASIRENCPSLQARSCNLKSHTLTAAAFYGSHGSALLRGGTTQGHEYQEARMIASHLGGWLPQIPLLNMHILRPLIYETAVQRKQGIIPLSFSTSSRTTLGFQIQKL